jgi:hypothetical protein
MMRTIMGMGCMVISSWACAQWQLATPVVVDGSTPQERQVTGLGTPEAGNHGASAAADRQNSTTYANATGVNTLTLDLTPDPGPLTPGMRITFAPAAINTGDATLSVNGSTPIALRKNVNAPLDSADLHAGLPVDVIYDGAVFQVTSQLYPGCPSGYKAVGKNVCIETVSREPANWYLATYTCGTEGKRLCGLSDWFIACIQNDNIFSTVSDYEWVDEAANSVNLAKLVGFNEVTLVPDCHAGGHRVPTSAQRYRCCYDR